MKQIKIHILAVMLIALLPATATHAQNACKYDLDKPFGWATCTSLEGGSFLLSGGEGGSAITLKSNGCDMGDTIINAFKDHDIVILDGSNGPFTISKTITMIRQQGKSLIGINGATLRTAFFVTDDIKAKLDSAGVKKRSTMDNGGTLSNGHAVREEMEFCVRQLLIDYFNDPSESYRQSGILKMYGCDNIIIRNIRFEGPGAVDVSGDDLLTATATTHLWVDHCDFVDGMDANFDINSRSDFITVSWCTFSYTERAYIHMNTNLVGASDNPGQGVDNLNVTFAYCIWGKGCDQRMPMARFGTIHVLNCLYDCSGNSAAANARKDCEMLVEGCYFMPGVNRPFWQKDAKAWNLRDNHFSTPFATNEQGKVNIPYDYERMETEMVPQILRGKGGAGVK